MFRATILLVDDDEFALNGLGHALWKSEYRLLFARNGKAALDLLEREQVDIVISDHLMPEMNGLEFLKRVKDQYPEIIRMMLTGQAEMYTALEAINEGEVYRLLLKPWDPAELLLTLHGACEKLKLERENRRLLALIRSEPELASRLEEEQKRRRAEALHEGDPFAPWVGIHSRPSRT